MFLLSHLKLPFEATTIAIVASPPPRRANYTDNHQLRQSPTPWKTQRCVFDLLSYKCRYAWFGVRGDIAPEEVFGADVRTVRVPNCRGALHLLV